MSTSPPLPRILVVEDEEDIAFILRFLFERNGFEVEVAADGRLALDCFDRGPVPAAVVLDIMLPYHDGLSLLAELRSRSEWREVPVLMLTAKAREGDIVRALESGANDYVTKPFQPEEVLARVRRMTRPQQ